MSDERTKKRLVGIARSWQKRFGLPYDALDDLIQSAWLLWLERPTVEIERRFEQVNSGMRRAVIKEIFGRSFRGGKINEPEPVYVSSEWIGDYETDFDNHVRVAAIARACNQAGTKTDKAFSGRSEHAKTLRMIAGLAPVGKQKTFKARCRRLRRFLESKQLAA